VPVTWLFGGGGSRVRCCLLVGFVSLFGSGCTLPGDHRVRALRYPDAYVSKWDGSRFRSVAWRTSAHPNPCSLTVRLPGGDLGPDGFANVDGLRRAGWSEDREGNLVRLWRQPPPALVGCVHEAGRLVEVTVTAMEGERAEVGVHGRWLTLPATEAEVTAAFGPASQD
jgi:hypothetical protein